MVVKRASRPQPPTSRTRNGDAHAHMRPPPVPVARRLPRAFSFPWGSGQIVEEVSGLTPWHEPTIQLLQYDDGAHALRFCYYRGARFGRGPMMVDEDALAQMADALSDAPRIRALLHKMLGTEK